MKASKLLSLIILGAAVGFTLNMHAQASSGGGIEPVEPRVCLDRVAICSPVESRLTGMRCWVSIFTGCCQEKDYEYRCSPNGPWYVITHETYKVIGSCTGDKCD
jgi:hypothetical protein